MGIDEVESVILPASPRSVGLARRFIAERVSGPRAYDASLVVSELVTNALVHSHGPLRLTSHRTSYDISIEVWDSDATVLPAPRVATGGQEGGRGLSIVAILCETWGHRPDPPGKTVWGILDLT